MVAETPPTSAYWRKTLRLSAILLALWFLLTLGVGLFGRSMGFRLFGWPFGFWVTAQVALVGYCVIVWVYALAMDRIDQAHGGHAGD
jgi:putative solute:sodium symporter small subunit